MDSDGSQTGFDLEITKRISLNSSIPVIASGGGGDMFQMGKTNIKIYGIENKLPTRFIDVAGQESAKQEIQDELDKVKKELDGIKNKK